MRPPTTISAHDPTWSAINLALEREILVSERLRATIIATLLGVIFVVAVSISMLAPDTMRLVWRRDGYPLGMFATILGACAYELGLRFALGRVLKRGGRFPAVWRYFTALVETSLPTLTMLYAAQMLPPVFVALFPPSWAYFVFIVASTLRMDFRLSLFTGAVAALEFGCFSLWALQSVPPGLPGVLTSLAPAIAKSALLLVTGAIAGLVGLELQRRWRNTLQTLQERNRVVEMFGQHVSPAVVDQLLAQQAELGTEVRHVCVLFLDIRGFTTFAESRRPEEVVAYLNLLFATMIDVINTHHGIVNKFLGDGFMAVFGAPLSDGQDCRNAVAAATEIVRDVEARVAAGDLPPTRLGIGMHAGEAVTGNVGSRARKEYTIIGDVVNLASRIEALNKDLGSSVLASAEVMDQLAQPPVGAQDRGEVPVRGRARGVRLWQLA